jgi:hypothetical protein
METQLQESPVNTKLDVANEVLANTKNDSLFSLNVFEHAQRVAIMLAKSDLIPQNYRGKVENTMIALEMAHRIKVSPLMVMQNLHVIQGRPSWSSPFIIATLNSCGRFPSGLKFKFTGDKSTDAYGCEAWARDKEGEILT